MRIYHDLPIQNDDLTHLTSFNYQMIDDLPI